VHARPVDIVSGPMRVRRLVLTMPEHPGAVDAALDGFRRFCRERGLEPPAPGSRQHGFSTASRHATWEFHNEFVTVTWQAPVDDPEDYPDDIGLEVLAEGRLIGATRIDILAEARVPDRLLPGFRLSSLCVAGIDGGAGEIATDFVADAAGFTRFEFAAGAMSPLRVSIMLRRLFEIDTYRVMTLLGLPLARTLSPEVRAAERELTGLIERLSDATSTEAVQASLAALHALSVRSGQIGERLTYRFAASKAYGEVLDSRLRALAEVPTSKGSSLSRHVGNRVDPALATCTALETRLRVLSEKIERGVGLLDARIGLDLQIQNRAVLETIARTAQSQFRLQRTVEGLSVIAITYYLLGILGYVLAGPVEWMHLDKVIVLSLAAPIALISVWLVIRAVRRRHF
jgi:uncharacterized membrane-anchored protein